MRRNVAQFLTVTWREMKKENTRLERIGKINIGCKVDSDHQPVEVVIGGKED